MTVLRQNPTRRSGRLQRRLLAALVALCPVAPIAPAVAATAVSPAAARLYQEGMAVRRSNPALALKDFAAAVRLAPQWEPPLYSEGAVLAVTNFKAALPLLLQAAKLDPLDDTVWNVIGWGYYQHHQFTAAETAFSRQLQLAPKSPEALWGLANCYANSAVRQFAPARTALLQMRGHATGALAASAAKMLAALPPDAVDASYEPNTPISYQDAIAMALSYRGNPATAGASAPAAADGQKPSPSVAPYIAFAAARGFLRNLAIPSYRQPATRLFAALLLARLYGVNRYDYIQPFPLSDMQGVPVNDVMYVDSILALRLMTTASPGKFAPFAPVSRAQMGQLVARANTVMAHPPLPATWLSLGAPKPAAAPFVYLFTTSQPSSAIQTADIAAHAGRITALGFTDYPFIADFPAGAARTREQTDHTKYILTAASAGAGVQMEMTAARTAGIKPFLVLANYNNVTDRADPAIVNRMLTNPQSAAGLVQEVAAVAKKEQLGGVTVDFEDIAPSDRQPLVSFVTALRAALTPLHMLTMVCLPEQSSSAGGQSPYDYRALGQAANLAMLITYDEHTPAGKPGPIATLSNVTRTVQYALQLIPRQKILLGLADYGYDWSSAGAVEVSMNQAQQLAAQHGATVTLDAASQSPTFSYSANGVTHTVWFENGQSLGELVHLAGMYGLGGFAVWHLGAENAQFWQAIASWPAG